MLIWTQRKERKNMVKTLPSSCYRSDHIVRRTKHTVNMVTHKTDTAKFYLLLFFQTSFFYSISHSNTAQSLRLNFHFGH